MILADAIPWSNVVLALGCIAGFVALVWVLGHTNRSLLDVEFRDRSKTPEWRYERTERKTDEWEADK